MLLLIGILYRGRYAGKFENRFYRTFAGPGVLACGPMIAMENNDMLKKSLEVVIVRH
jgi:hypothetical protein